MTLFPCSIQYCCYLSKESQIILPFGFHFLLQGGALSLFTGMTSKHQLGGILALSCWLPLHKDFPVSLTLAPDTRVLQLHGDCDPVVPYKWGQLTSTLLKTYLKAHEFKTYKSLGHSSSPGELEDIQKFISEVLLD